MSSDSNPVILIQNRHHQILSQTDERLELYRLLLQRRLDHAEEDMARFKVPRLRGRRLRLPGKPFHDTPEIFFQEGGRTHFEFPQETLPAGPGGVMLVPARMPHGERWSGQRFLNLIVMFQVESVSLHLGYLEHGGGSLRCGPIDRFDSVDRFATIRYAEEMTEVSGKDPTSQRLKLGLYVSLLARLIQGVCASDLTQPHRYDRIDHCKEMIAVHACKLDFSVAWLAQELGCSPDHLSRRFRGHTGTRIMEAVHWRRIDHARHLLCTSDMNMAEIAWTCGFSQPSYFNRVFKALTGTTPKAFRRGSGSRYHHRTG